MAGVYESRVYMMLLPRKSTGIFFRTIPASWVGQPGSARPALQRAIRKPPATQAIRLLAEALDTEPLLAEALVAIPEI